MAAAESLKSVAKIVQVLNEGAKKDVAIWISASPAPTQQKMQFEPIALFFGIWHEARRGGTGACMKCGIAIRMYFWSTCIKASIPQPHEHENEDQRA